MNIDNLTEEQIKALERQKLMMKFSPSGIHPDRVGIENMSDEQIRSLEAQRNRYEPGPSGIHPDRVGIENMSDEQIRSLEAQVQERKTIDTPYQQYFKELIEKQVISDKKQFEESVIRSMQSNGIIKTFVNNIINEITNKAYEFKTTDINNKVEIDNKKNEIERLVSIYERYLYTLKNNGWSFDLYGFDVQSLRIPEDIHDILWQIQKKYEITFNMPIPANLGEDYGKEFEREGKMIPGLTLMYEDLKGKSVNWHQVLNYGENELTPYQKYKQRMLEKMQEETNQMKL